MTMIIFCLLVGICVGLGRANPSLGNVMPVASPVSMSDVDRHQLDMINMPHGFSQKYLDFDPCLSSPCMFGRICKSVLPAADTTASSSPGYVCLNEIDANKEISDARTIYRNMELLAKEAILLNVETITHGSRGDAIVDVDVAQQPLEQSAAPETSAYEHVAPASGYNNEQNVMLTLKSKKPVRLLCEQNPCQKDEKCIPKPESVEGHICIRTRITVVEDENNQIIAKLLSDNKFIIESATRCEAASHGQKSAVQTRLEIFHLPTHFVSCLDKPGEFTILTCPEGLVFNKHLDRCDMDQEPIGVGCASSPCQFGATCHDLSLATGGDYMCSCPVGFSGKNCQIAPDVCATAPCGESPGNVCHVLPAESGLHYFCTCFSGKAFGFSCEQDKVERNPCDESNQVGSVFSTRLGPSVFGLCDQDHQLNLRVCDKQMQAAGKCKWLSRLGLQRTKRGAGRNSIRKRQ